MLIRGWERRLSEADRRFRGRAYRICAMMRDMGQALWSEKPI